MTVQHEAYTITFCDRAENHVGMQIIGQLADHGFDEIALLKIADKFHGLGANVELINLGGLDFGNAYLLVVRGGVDVLLGKSGANMLYFEQTCLKYDNKMFSRGRVVNKHMRHNLCFSDFNQIADFETGKGTVVAFQDTSFLDLLKKKLEEITGLSGLQAEANHYYDLTRCGIGFHGDAERRIVIGVRTYGQLDASSRAPEPDAALDLEFAWFKMSERVSEITSIPLGHGDIYFMAEKTTGFDWRRRNIPTLRHAVGAV